MKISEQTILGTTGIRVSRIGFGVHPLGPSRKNLSIEDGAELMLYAYRQGIHFFDIAQFYHTYAYLRRGLERITSWEGYEGLPVISSKSLAEDYEGMANAIDEALCELNLGVIDIFLMHQVTPGDFEVRAGAWRALCDAKAAGKVRAIGISTHHQDVVMEAAGRVELDIVFAMYNYAGLGIRCGEEAGTAEGMRAALKACRRMGKGVYIMKVFGGGNLLKDYQKALHHVFVEQEELIPAAVIGFTSEREIDDLKGYLSGCMNADYHPPLEQMKLRVDHEDCMGCGTCVRICASGAMHYSPVDGLAEINHEKCVGCNYCVIACPERAIVLW